MQCEGRREVRSLQPDVATQTQCRQQDNRDTISRCGGYRDGELCDVTGLLYEVQLLIIDSDSDFVGRQHIDIEKQNVLCPTLGT